MVYPAPRRPGPRTPLGVCYRPPSRGQEGYSGLGSQDEGLDFLEAQGPLLPAYRPVKGRARLGVPSVQTGEPPRCAVDLSSEPGAGPMATPRSTPSGLSTPVDHRCRIILSWWRWCKATKALASASSQGRSSLGLPSRAGISTTAKTKTATATMTHVVLFGRGHYQTAGN